MPTPLPPLRSLVLSVSLKSLRVLIPGPVAVAFFAFALTPAALWLIPGSGGGSALPAVAPVPMQTASVLGMPLGAAAAALGGLPEPGPNQVRAGEEGCNLDDFEVHNGGCWLQTSKTPPCPATQWEHEKRCWFPVARAARVPTSGELRPRPVADP